MKRRSLREKGPSFLRDINTCFQMLIFLTHGVNTCFQMLTSAMQKYPKSLSFGHSNLQESPKSLDFGHSLMQEQTSCIHDVLSGIQKRKFCTILPLTCHLPHLPTYAIVAQHNKSVASSGNLPLTCHAYYFTKINKLRGDRGKWQVE